MNLKNIRNTLETGTYFRNYEIAIISIVIFSIVLLGLAIPRSQFEYVVTDTDYIDLPPFNVGDIYNILTTDPYPEWFRPIEYMIMSKEIEIFKNNLPPMIFLQSAIPAAAAVVIFFIMTEFTKKRWLQIAIPLIYSFDMSVIETTWLFLHKVILADFLIILSMYSFIRYIKTNHTRWFIVLCASATAAPWIREIPAILPLILILITIIMKKKDLKLVIGLPLLSIHAIFPSFFIKLILAQEFVLQPIFRRNFVGNSIGDGVHTVNFDLPLLTALHFTPILTMVLLSCVVIFLSSKKIGVPLAGGVVFVLVSIIYYWQHPQIPQLTWYVPIAFAAIVAIGSVRFNKILPVWFALPMLPFVVVPTHTAWLKMSALPLLIIFALWIDHMPDDVRKLKRVLTRT